MIAKKCLAGCMVVVMLGIMVAGCGNSLETEEEIITMKEGNGGSSESGISDDREEGGTDTAKTGEGGIAEQVQAPERYAAEIVSGNVTVEVDAPVIIPAGEGFKTYRVKGRPFEQADYDAVSHVLLKDAGLWQRDYDAMSASGGFTREEIEAKIGKLEKEMQELEAINPETVDIYEKKVDKGFEKELNRLAVMLEEASEEPVIVEVPAIITVDIGDEKGRNKETGWLDGCATVDGVDYVVSIDNMFREDWRWNTFRILKKEEESGYFPSYYSYVGVEEEQGIDVAFSIDEIRVEAMGAVAAMGFSDFEPYGEYYAVYNSEVGYESAPAYAEKIGYGIHFTRSLEGVPVTYTAEMGTTLEDEESVVWPYENLTLVYNEEGLVNFTWENPYEVEKVSDEYLFLLPFSEIQNIFEEMIVKKYQDWLDGNEDMRLNFEIDEVRLGYMRVREKNNSSEATMVPVWDFMGTQRIAYENEIYDESSVYNSYLTINALDGTIIDRGFGY